MVQESASILRVPVVRSNILGVKVYRGFAKVCDLADISNADIYDQKNNPLGTQRDLSPAHAREAYEYVKTKDFGFWPEVFLCVRNRKCITYHVLSDELDDLGILEIDVAAATSGDTIAISRVDGNHRLHYGDGVEKGYVRITKLVSFCLAYDLNREEEIQLFKDINKNQKAMNTSHLDGIEVRLTSEDELKKRKPELYIAQRLHRDPTSPLHDRIYEGGKKPVGVDIPLRGLKSGIQYMLSRSTQLPRLLDSEAQYRVIRNYFSSVKEWQPKAWSNPKEYILLRGAGLWAVCFLGAHVIDRALVQDKFDIEYMLGILRSGREWDWGRKGDFVGFSGRGGALEISNRIARKLEDENKMSTDDLFRSIMSSD
ncbi:MAG: DGQHR domain-containing protein [Candidatus Aegiribacteria sp.]|nr:DGQHR domain-containing protein [Candidatus Aegiribacteria sp.]